MHTAELCVCVMCVMCVCVCTGKHLFEWAENTLTLTVYLSQTWACESLSLWGSGTSSNVFLLWEQFHFCNWNVPSSTIKPWTSFKVNSFALPLLGPALEQKGWSWLDTRWASFCFPSLILDSPPAVAPDACRVGGGGRGEQRWGREGLPWLVQIWCGTRAICMAAVQQPPLSSSGALWWLSLRFPAGHFKLQFLCCEFGLLFSWHSSLTPTLCPFHGPPAFQEAFLGNWLHSSLPYCHWKCSSPSMQFFSPSPLLMWVKSLSPLDLSHLSKIPPRLHRTYRATFLGMQPGQLHKAVHSEEACSCCNGLVLPS